jgi:hypothetical protein
MEPVDRLELTTCCLQNSTNERIQSCFHPLGRAILYFLIYQEPTSRTVANRPEQTT